MPTATRTYVGFRTGDDKDQGAARPLLGGTREWRKLRDFYVVSVNYVHLKELLVQIHRFDQKERKSFRVSNLQECQLRVIREALEAVP